MVLRTSKLGPGPARRRTRIRNRDKSLPFIERCWISPFTDQPGLPPVVFDNDRPIIEAHKHIGHIEIGRGYTVNMLVPATQIVGKITNGTARKR